MTARHPTTTPTTLAVMAAILAVTGAGVGDAEATVWKRVRPDGTVEFTNVAPRGSEWSAVKESQKARISGPRRTRSAPPPPATLVDPTAPPAAAAAGPRLGSPLAPDGTAVISSPPRPGRAVASRSSVAPGSVVWARDHEDGTMEFTNVNPVGARWKVLFRTGPGKASALRGSSDVVPPTDGSPSRFARYDEHIRDQQAFYGIPQALIRAVIKTESDFDPNVVSSAGCIGLMQLMPSTAKLMGVTDIWDPRQNIMGGARYLQTLAKRFCKTPAGGSATDGLVCSLEEKIKVVAGYHAGPGAVEKYGGMPPYETTRYYVTTVLTRYEDFRRREAAFAAEFLSVNK
jgi:hypothetical protein